MNMDLWASPMQINYCMMMENTQSSRKITMVNQSGWYLFFFMFCLSFNASNSNYQLSSPIQCNGSVLSHWGSQGLGCHRHPHIGKAEPYTKAESAAQLAPTLVHVMSEHWHHGYNNFFSIFLQIAIISVHGRAMSPMWPNHIICV